jgi:hypothetical protein
MRSGTAKQEKADCNGATSRVKPENTEAGGRTFVQRSCGNNLRIPANTKNIPVSNRTEIRCISMSPVATGKLSRLSSCINGESTAISTISMSTIFGILRGIKVIRRGRLWKSTVTPLSSDCGDYSTAVIKCNNINFIGLQMRLTGNSSHGQIPDSK